MTVPDAVNSTSVPVAVDARPSTDSAEVIPRTTDAVEPLASAICDATVRFQMRS